MRIDWSTLLLQTINALVLIWLLARFLFRPVAGIIAERQKAAQALIADADAAKHAAALERDAAVHADRSGSSPLARDAMKIDRCGSREREGRVAGHGAR